VNNRPLHVLHVGPDVDSTGGMASVIGLLCGAPGTDVRSSSATTWSPASRTRGLVPTARLLGRLAFGPRTARPDWVHAHLSEGGSFVREGAVLLVARLLGIGTAATLHGAQFLDFSRRHPRLVRRVLAGCRTVFPLGPHAAARVAELSPATPVRPVLNPLDLAELAGVPASPRAADVVFGGEVGRRKGADRLVAAWPEVRRAHPEATCVLCGPLGDVPVTDLPEGMTYLGALPRTELLGVLKAARVACLPSRDEALPMFVLESLGLGVPVVTTPVGEIDQLGEAQGVALTDGDPARLAARLTALLAEPDERARWGGRGAGWARENCSVESVSRVLADSYRAA
jgi:glycosyltransferase involved in cell wall biosynthesis